MDNVSTLLVVLCFVTHSSCDSSPFITLNQGALLGRYFETRKGRTIIGFSGIPYAKPPIGDLRFKPPVPFGHWIGVLNATEPHPICPQFNYYDKNNPIVGVEDCLFLNVYTPRIPNDGSQYPVIFYIHGGTFSIGSARYDWLGPELIMDQDIVLVTANYRLGVLGFLTTGDSSIPGNNGLKDQVFALKWVKENIASFGGDPEKVTISGNSAGASSVHHLTLSPLSKGLFSSAIMQSGIATSQISIISRNQSIQYAYLFGEKFNCTMKTGEGLRKCLRNIDAYDIVRQQLSFSTWDPSATPFKPTIEESGSQAFLSKNPFKVLQSSDVIDIPIAIGIVPNEGVIVSAALSQQGIDEMEGKFHTRILNDFNLRSLDETNYLRTFYFGNTTVSKDTRPGITDLYTDGWFLSGADHLVQNHLIYRKQQIYFYIFNYRGSESYGSLYNDTDFIHGASHTDELFYLFPRRVAFPNYSPTAIDNEMTDVMTTMWYNFARYGNPTPKHSRFPLWNSVRSDSLEYYYIEGPHQLGMRSDPYTSRRRLWRNISIDVESFNP